jgi:3-dehydroquinate dehydratase/shikimate dehydrogenase
MNNGRICISVQAATIAEFVAKIETHTGNSDLIELRFDSLDSEELGAEDITTLTKSMSRILGAATRVPCITTFRPKQYGGFRSISDLERENFWNQGNETDLADLEEDVVAWSSYWLWSERICSFHDFSNSPPELGPIFERLARTGVDIVKIAVQIDDAVDAIQVWSLLEHSGIQTIPIAMGEAGKWTRILGLAYGAPITYAAPANEPGTAPGQLTAKDLTDVFRVKELDRETQIYGVVAGDTSYSLSPYMHNAAFKATVLNSVFVPFQVRDLEAFVRRIVRRETREVNINVRGLSVTNPHKQTIIPLLDELDPTARAIGAVNTVKIDGNKLIGFNTDAPGFIEPLERAMRDIRDARVAVVGAGGAARACVHALSAAGAHVVLLARDVAKAEVFAQELGIDVDQLATGSGRPLTADILVNATPLGTRGALENESVATADELRNVKLVYDLVYNPAETRLIREAKSAGAQTLGGLDMLIAQGAKQFAIWTGGEAPLATMRMAVEKRLQ